MSDVIKVNTSRLGQDADRVKTCITEMKRQIAVMKTQAAQLDAMWDGPSSDVFRKNFQDDVATLEAVLKNLETIYRFETEAKKKYDSCEKRVGNIVAGIKV